MRSQDEHHTVVAIASMPQYKNGQKFSLFDTEKQQIRPQESSLANFVLPVLHFCRNVGFSADYFYYGPQGKITFSKGSSLRKTIACLLFLLEVCGLIGMECLYEKTTLQSTPMKLLFRFVTCAYIFYASCKFCCLNMFSEKTVKVLHQLQDLENELLSSKAAGLSHPKTAARISYYAMAAYALFIFWFWLTVRMNLAVLLQEGFISWTRHIAELSLTAARACVEIPSSWTPAMISLDQNIGIAIPYALLTFFYDCRWIMGLVVTTMWGFSFVSTFRAFQRTLSDGQTPFEVTIEDIQKFNRIVSTVESFNDAFGILVLGATASGMAYFAVETMKVLKSEADILTAILTIVCFAVYTLQLVVCAEVSRSAGTMKRVLKNRFNSISGGGKVVQSRMDIEMTSAMMLFMDLSAGNIGFEGLGFFTLNYSLIRSVVGLIATYAVVTVQLN